MSGGRDSGREPGPTGVCGPAAEGSSGPTPASRPHRGSEPGLHGPLEPGHRVGRLVLLPLEFQCVTI